MEIVLRLHQRVVLHSVRVTRSARVKAIAAMITMRSARKVKLILFAILSVTFWDRCLQPSYSPDRNYNWLQCVICELRLSVCDVLILLYLSVCLAHVRV